jgi:hypothetical protein
MSSSLPAQASSAPSEAMDSVSSSLPTQASSAPSEADIVESAGSSSCDDCDLPFGHSWGDGSVERRDQGGRRPMELPCLLTARVEDAKAASGFQAGGLSLCAHAKVSLLPGYKHIPMVCMGQLFLPSVCSVAITPEVGLPSLCPSQRSGDPRCASTEDVVELQRSTLMLRNLPGNYSR